MRKRFILSANAIAPVGGQGLNLHHMIEALSPIVDVSLFSRGDNQTVSSHVVPPAKLSRKLANLPIVRRRRDWIVLSSDLQFDRHVSRNLPQADIFQGVVGQCALSACAAKSMGMKIILDVVNTHIDDFDAASRQECDNFGVGSFIHPQMKRRILDEYEQADLIRVMSEYAKETFLRKGFSENKLMVVRPPINVQEFPDATFSNPNFRISFVGLLEPWKGFHYLIRAFESLQIKDSELLLWGGSGARPIAKYLQACTRRTPSIRIRPVEVRQAGYDEVYAQASVLVHPSLSDGFSYVVIEAMASGVPVIVSNTTGAAEMIEDGKNGYIVPPGDWQAIRDRLLHLYNNSSLLKEMGQAAKASVRNLTSEAFRNCYVSALSRL